MSSVSPLLQHFASLEAPRVQRTQLHSLENILTIAICAVICGAEGWVEIEEFGESKQDFFTQLLDLTNGIPSHDTFGRVFAALDAQAFADCFTSWISTLAQGVDQDIIAIDGKTLRRSLDKANGKAAIHLVSAFACTNRLVLGQVKVESKSNEITAIPELLRRLVLSGSLVTIDAMGCQKAIAHQLHEAGADYVLSLKENHPGLYNDVSHYFDYVSSQPERLSEYEDVDAGHGRIERRTVQMTHVDWLPEKACWCGLHSIIRVIRERYVGNEVSRESCYFISTLRPTEAQRAATAIRSHWQIETQLHWCLDIAFNEDQQRMREGNAAANMALLNKIALNLLRLAPTTAGIKARRKRAGWDGEYLLTVLGKAHQI
ncbi:ISAs1 family transposase [Xenorhabdus nematophila]|uniref:ISAs1 family transposase n=2 Tax=Xenorhabdus nematophila TaxID=628 RepID=UPI0032B77DEF